MSVDNSTAAQSWRAVVGFERLYEVSDAGAVRSVSRCVRTTRGITRRVTAVIKKQSHHKQGYRIVGLCRDNKHCTALVHRLVAAAFIGPISEDVEVNHKDGNKQNNALANLEIVTRQENIDHAVRTGLIDNKGEKNAQAKLSAEQVKEIRTLYRPGGNPGYKALGVRFGVSWGIVRDIVKRRVWRHVET